MDYHLEALGDERFQKLCQALLTTSFPNVQCLPVGQPDGGRDAFMPQPSGFIVFQVKYSRNPSTKTERIAVSDVIKAERHKVDLLIKKGASAFYLMTNVSGSSHLDEGSVDKINTELSKTFGIPSFCWWRDDIERRIEVSDGLIWRYPEIFRGSDFLEIFVSGKTIRLTSAKAAVFRAYVAAQYARESEVRFQQVQIQNSLFDLFTDTPIGSARDKMPSREACNLAELPFAQISATTQSQRYRLSLEDDPAPLLAADWLLSVGPERGLQRIVLEGAPGQGKSTVTQYITQLQRMRSLRRSADTTKVPAGHLAGVVRMPLRVDLRDYAVWLIGNDPFAAEKEVRRPSKGVDGIESFLSHQIFVLSGGREFEVGDLLSMLTDGHCMLILDGFDEVADKATRVRLIEQIRNGSERLATDCQSVQVIVTSRPSAFVLSPGFPEREWLHLALLPMRIKQIEQYADKWIIARNFRGSEGKDFKDLLLDRVSRSHIRSLAQNPMQLAILLSLISTKGRSLPDKRTALYDSYIDLFFGREAEKDVIVRENRDVLIQIHQHVAWILSLDAEKPGGSGSISQSDLEALVRQFLTDKQHEGDVLRLFTGVVERVGALVSRVQGMLEFEVQPLREYFTGRYLYETAPYSPPGAEKGGTRPQRFNALARRPYWLNVARFYAGCYNSGELASLLSGLQQLEETDNPALTRHALQLGLLLLNDWVFSQEPRTIRDVIAFLTSKNNLRTLIANSSSWDDDRLALPEKCGRKDFVSKVRDAFDASTEAAYLTRLGVVLTSNCNWRERWSIWLSLREKGEHALFQASCLGLFNDVTGVEQQRLITTYGNDARQLLISSGRWDSLSHSDQLAALQALATSGPSAMPLRMEGRVVRSDIDLCRVYLMLNPALYGFLSYDRTADVPLDDYLRRFGFHFPSDLKREGISKTEAGFSDVVTAAIRASRATSGQWRTSLDPWSDLVESVRRTWGDGVRTYCLAAVAAGIVSKEARASGYSDVLNRKMPLVERARFARLKTGLPWWSQILTEGADDSLWVLILLFSWAPGGVIKGLHGRLTETLEELDSDSWGDLISSVRAVISATSAGRQPISGFDEEILQAIGSQRLKALLVLRLPRVLSTRVLADLFDNYSGEDSHLFSYLAARAVNETQRELKSWNSVVSFFEKHGSGSLPSSFRAFSGHERAFYGRREALPSALLQRVRAGLDRLPLQLLEAVEMSSPRRLDANSEVLRVVAEEERWFS